MPLAGNPKNPPRPGVSILVSESRSDAGHVEFTCERLEEQAAKSFPDTFVDAW